MNKLKFFLPLAAVGLLASCSSDNLGEPNPEIQDEVTTGEGAYFNINLSIPTVTGTKADEDNDYKVGEANEYAVNNATMYIFNEVSEAPGVLLKAVTIDKYFDLEDHNAPEIKGVKKLDAMEIQSEWGLTQTSGKYDNFYILIILNKGGLNGVLPAEGETFNTWATKVISYSGSDGQMIEPVDNVNYFTMTNALGWDISEGTTYLTGNPTVCTKVTADNIYYKNQNTNQNNTEKKPVNIYVQRGVAKVTIGSSNIKVGEWCPVKTGLGDPSNINKVDYIKITGWSLDNTNLKSYPAQLLTNDADYKWWDQRGLNIAANAWNTATAPLARFISLTSPAIEEAYARCFWGVDPNYSNAVDASHYTRLGTTATLGNPAQQYCLENTFDVDHMVENHTTRVVLEGYYLPQQEATVASDANPTLLSFISYNGNCIVPNAEFQAKYMYNLAEAYERIQNSQDETLLDANYTIAASDLFLPFTEASVNVESAGDDANQKAALIEAARTEYYRALTEILDALKIPAGSDARVNYHNDGHVYYTVLLRHFSDTELDMAAAQNAGDLGQYLKYENGTLYVNYATYPNDKDNYLLGRYGTLRNNWYELRLTGVSAVGTSYIPPTTDHLDDEQGTLIDVEIYINAWAKRQQGVTFK